MNTRLPFIHRHTLNGRTPRTLRDAGRDPYDWADGPYKPRTPPRTGALLNVLMAVLIGIAAALLAVHELAGG